MDELLTLEPRIAGEDTAEPDADFGDQAGSLHMNCYCGNNTRILCTSNTFTLYCEDGTRLC